MQYSVSKRLQRLLLTLGGIWLFLVIFIDVDDDTPTPLIRGPPKRRPKRRVVEEWNKDEVLASKVPWYLPRTMISLVNDTEMPTTKIHRHVPGWTLLDNVYLRQGTLFVVRDPEEPIRVPQIRMMISSGKPIRHEPQDEARREPSERNLRVIDTAQAKKMFGDAAKRIEGTSFIIYEAPQYFEHPYNFLAETFFGLWRTYSSLDQDIPPDGTTSLEAPLRFVLPNIVDFHWRDRNLFIPKFLYAAFPSTTVQPSEDWKDYSDLDMTFFYERVLLVDRNAAMRDESFATDLHIAAATTELAASPHWWAPIRNKFYDLSGVDPVKEMVPGARREGRPIITYISRQGHGRASLKDADHEELIRELSRLENTYGYDVRVYRHEVLSLEDQVRIASKATILMGIHGEAVLPLLWMLPSKNAAIIEFFRDNDKSENYAWNANVLGIDAYAFYGSRNPYKYPLRPKSVAKPSGDTPVRVLGSAVAALCVDILSRS